MIVSARQGERILFWAEPETRQQLALVELERTLGCELINLNSLSDLNRHSQQHNMALLELTPDNCLELAQWLQALDAAGTRVCEQLILFQRQPGAVQLDPFWQLQLVLFIPALGDLDSLYTALDRFFSRRRERLTLSHQLKEASDIAMLSMAASSQLGEIIRFLERSYDCGDFVALGELLNQTLERLGVAGCGLISDQEGGLVYFGPEDRQPYWQRLMQQMRNLGRLVDIENRTIANFDSISVLARNMPEVDSEPYGRMKDMLFTLVEGAEARVRTLALERAVGQSEKAKSTFLRLMSHELRTPMNAILGFSARLGHKAADAPFTVRDAEAARMIQHSADRLMEMIEDLEDLSRVNVDADAAAIPVLVDDVLAETLSLAARRARDKGLDFHQQFHEPAGLAAELDPVRLNQVVKKLCANAIKYTSSGEITVTVGADYHPRQGELLWLSVSDTGVGMSAEQVEGVLQAKPRHLEDYRKHHQGIGLGVSVVREFVVEMGGWLELTSEPGQGTCCRITLPRYHGAGPEQSVHLF